METITTLLPILAALAVGVISPGPSFILVAQTSVASSRCAGLASAFGMATGATLLSIVALLGLHAILAKVPMLYTALKVVGGAYLLYLAAKVWRGAKQSLTVPGLASSQGHAPSKAFWRALATMLSNPKAAVQYGVIFAALLPQTPSATLVMALPVAVFALEASWYSIVSFVLSAQGPRNRYLTVKTSADRVTGAVLSVLGIKLLLSSR